MRQISENAFPQDWHESCLWQKRTYIYIETSRLTETFFQKKKLMLHSTTGLEGKALLTRRMHILNLSVWRGCFFLTLPKHLPHRIGRNVDFGTQDTYIEVSRFGEVVFFD